MEAASASDAKPSKSNARKKLLRKALAGMREDAHEPTSN
jgi:hypothetical protein